jgi:hypothetical protein
MLGLKGRARDRERAHPAQGGAVCAPPEATERVREPEPYYGEGEASGADGFGYFRRNESNPPAMHRDVRVPREAGSRERPVREPQVNTPP